MTANSQAARILSVEDDPDIAELLAFHMKSEGFDFLHLDHGTGAVAKALEYKPDLILLDVMLPGKSGLEICQELRSHEELRQTPVILLTARGGEDDIVRGLEVGADDYVVKPFSARVLVAKLRRAVRRTHREGRESEVLQLCGLMIDPLRHELRQGDQVLELTSSEFRALHFLAGRPGWVFTRHQIMAAVHGEGYVVSERSIDVMIVGLRKKMGMAGKYVETVRGVGYRFSE